MDVDIIIWVIVGIAWFLFIIGFKSMSTGDFVMDYINDNRGNDGKR
jgi:hypothetical protein